MSALFVTSLLLLALCPAFLRTRYGRGWTARPFSLLVLMALAYHGVGEVLIRATDSGRYSVWRQVPQEYIDQGMFVAAASLLAMTVAYCITAAPLAEDLPLDLDRLRRVFDWRLTGLLALPLLAATVRGAGFASASAERSASIGFSTQFLTPLVVLTSFGLLLRRPQWFGPIVAVQCLALAVAGQRLEVVVAAAMLWLLAHRVNLAPTRRQLVAVTAVVFLLGFAITSVRSSQGRAVFNDNTGPTARVSALAGGITHPSYESSFGAGPVGDIALRVDCNAWAGQVMRALDEGHPPIGWTPLLNATLTPIPSALWPEKLTTLTLNQRSTKGETASELGLPRQDVLPGHLTLFLGDLGPWMLIMFNALAGLVLGVADRWALRRVDVLPLLGVMLLGQGALFYERGLPSYLIAGRSLVALGLVLAAWAFLRQRRNARRRVPIRVR
jgi:hypothetical protein